MTSRIPFFYNYPGVSSRCLRAVALGLLLLWWTGTTIVSASFNPATWVPGDVGNPSVAGATTFRQGIVEIVAGGQGIGFKADEFHFAAALDPGDFDVRVRVTALKNTDLWAKA